MNSSDDRLHSVMHRENGISDMEWEERRVAVIAELHATLGACFCRNCKTFLAANP